MHNWTEWAWLKPVAALALVEWLGAESLALAIHFRSRPDFIDQFLFGLGIGLGMLAGFYVWHFAKLTHQKNPNPMRHLVELTGDRRARILAVAAGLICITVHWIAFSWTKSMLPTAVPFWADSFLADLDEALLGRAAWDWALTWFGFASDLLKRAYNFWLLLHLLVLAGVLLLPPSLRKTRLLIAYFLMWMIGTVVSFAFSSAGPIFYEPLGLGYRFHDLASQPHIGRIPQTAAYILSNYQDHAARPGAGISAFPSMHVALAVWIALAIRHWAGWVFAGMIFVGSFLLGWHYFVDAPAGVLVTLLAYGVAGTYCAWVSAAREVPPFVEPSVEKSLADGPPIS
jgi:hypothetical protein